MTNLRPAPAAKDLADQMVQMDDIHRTILSETLDGKDDGQIRESGRTICPRNGSVKGPGKRYPKSVQLAGCPLERGGTWHTHVTPGQLRNPKNSLPDMANVVYGLIDASVVSGTDSTEAIISAEDERTMVEAFQQAIGVDAESPEEVYEAVTGGEVNPIRARRRARAALKPLIMTRQTGFPDLRQRVSTGPVSFSPSDGHDEVAGCTCHNVLASKPTLRGEMQKSCEQMSASMEEVGRKASGAGVELGPLVISNAVGTVVGGVVDRILFD